MHTDTTPAPDATIAPGDTPDASSLPDQEARRDALRVYLACLASYNGGTLHGAWCDATDADELRDAVAAMPVASPTRDAEEFAIHDHEGFGSWGPDEYEGLDEVAAKGAFILERGDVGRELLAHFSGRLDEAEAAFEEYAGEWPDLGHFAEDLTEQSGVAIPDSVRLYVDYDAMGRDLELGGNVLTVRISSAGQRRTPPRRHPPPPLSASTCSASGWTRAATTAAGPIGASAHRSIASRLVQPAPAPEPGDRTISPSGPAASFAPARGPTQSGSCGTPTPPPGSTREKGEHDEHYP